MMILRNWYSGVQNHAVGSYSTVKDIYGTVHTLNGTDFYSSSSAWYQTGVTIPYYMNTVTNNRFDSTGIKLGNGILTPTIDDHWLSGSFAGNLSTTVHRTLGVDDAGHAYVEAVITATNNTGVEQTVSECGVVAYRYVNASYNSAKYLMLDRTLLDAPVTIPVGGIGKITYRITMPSMVP